MKRERFRAIALQAAVLVVLGTAAGVVGNALRPDGIALIGRWPDQATPPCSAYAMIAPAGAPPCLTLDDMTRLVGRDGVLLIDGRDSADFHTGHIPDAASLPYYDAAAAFPAVKDRVRAAEMLVVYCEGRDCELALFLASDLRDAGYDSVYVYAGGFDEWAAAGFPVRAGSED